MHNQLSFRSKTLLYISVLILIVPTIIRASRPAAGAGEFAHTAVGGKRHSAHPKDGEPSAKKQKTELENDKSESEYQSQRNQLLLCGFGNPLDFEHLDFIFPQAIKKNDVEFVQTALNNESAKAYLQRGDAFESDALHARTPAMAQALAHVGCLGAYKEAALVYACRNGRHTAELVQWYIDHGAQVDGEGFIAEIALLRHISCSPGSNSPGHPKVRILLQEGALLRPYGNNILEAMREREKHDKYNAHLLVVPFQEIRLILKQHSDYRHTGIYQDLAACTTTQTTESPVQLPRPLQTLIVRYYIEQEKTYEELEQEENA